MMVGVDKAVVAHLKVDGRRFEILVDCDEALKLKDKKKVDMKDVLAADEIYSDAKKGMLASENELKTLFGTSDPVEVAREIILKGEVQMTAAHKKKMLEEKRKKIVEFIRVHGIDPRTNLPHPPARIENAFEEGKIKIDEHKTAEQQIDDIISKLRPILPIKIATQEVAVKIPSQYAAKVYPTIKQQGNVKSEDWQNDGSLVVIVELPGGLREEYLAKLNSMTHGSIEAKVLKTK